MLLYTFHAQNCQGLELRRKTHLLLKWHSVYILLKASILTKPKEEGGLGIQAAKPKNTALLAKPNWRFNSEKSSLWVRVLSKKYLKQRRGFRTQEAYQLAVKKDEDLSRTSFPGAWVWKILSLPKVLWQCCHYSIPVITTLNERGMGIPPTCPALPCL